MHSDDSLRQLSASGLNEQLLGSITDFAIIATDINGHIIYWGVGAARILGWDADEMLGQPAARFFTPEDNSVGRPNVEMEQALLVGRSRDERWHVRKNGERFWSMGELMPMKDAAGNVSGFVKVMMDRTEQNLAVTDMLQQQSLLQSEVVTRTQERDRIWAISRDLLLTLGNDGRFGALNPAFTTELGYPEDALAGAHFALIIHPDDLSAAQAAFEQMVSGCPITDFDCRIRTHSGAYRWYSWTSSAENGLIYAYGRDISARKELEQRRQQTQKAEAERRIAEALARQTEAERDRLTVLFEQAPSFMAVLRSPEHVFEFANAAFQQLFGRPELVGKKAHEVFPDIEGQGFFELLDEVYASGKPFIAHDARLLLERAPGTAPEEIFVDLLYQPLLAPDGTISGIFANGYDVTERKRTHDALRQLNDTLEQRVQERTAERNQLWEHSPDLISVYTPEGRFVAVNRAFRSILGYEPEELVGKTFRDFVHPDDVARAADGVADSVKSARIHIVNRWRHKNGEYRWISWTANNDQETLFAMGRDVTEEKAQAEALQRAEEALRQAQKMEAVGQLTGGLAHDFNNMLGGISGNLELLRIRIGRGETQDIPRYIKGALDVVDRAAALTHRLLAFSRRQTLDPKPTDVNHLVGSMEDLMRRTLGPAISLETILGSDLWTALCDPSQLENAVLNLAINSRDAMPDGGRLTIDTANVMLDEHDTIGVPDLEPGEYVRICVSDTGAGMPADVLRRAVDPFFTTKPIGQGTGLGLSMIYGFVAQSKGDMRIYSQPGIGTTVHLYLPRRVGAPRADAISERLSDAPRPERKFTVLLVEDEKAIRKMSAEMLADLGYAVVEAADGVEGLKLLRSLPHIDLLVTDVGLPNGMNGRQLADAGREITADLKVLFITGFAETAAVHNGLVETGMQVMTKPFSMVSFAKKVRSMVESTA